jgi:hypothetical protein
LLSESRQLVATERRPTDGVTGAVGSIRILGGAFTAMNLATLAVPVNGTMPDVPKGIQPPRPEEARLNRKVEKLQATVAWQQKQIRLSRPTSDSRLHRSRK